MDLKMSTEYNGRETEQIAFPIGGIGAGCVMLYGNGMLGGFSINNHPAIRYNPNIFAALFCDGTATVLEGQVPYYKISGSAVDYGFGFGNTTFGLQRYRENKFNVKFPFAGVNLTGSELPFDVEITAWNPFIPGNPDDSGLPAAGLEYKITNKSKEYKNAVFSFHIPHMVLEYPVPGERRYYDRTGDGFIIRNIPGNDTEEFLPRSFALSCDADKLSVNLRWKRSGFIFDDITMLWRDIESGICIDNDSYTDGYPGDGASVYAPVSLDAGECRKIRVALTWHSARSFLKQGYLDLSECGEPGKYHHDATYSPWYSSRFSDAADVIRYFNINYNRLKEESVKFSECFYETDLPEPITEAVAANLSILKSPTLLRQTDGRVWGWEGCGESAGSCWGSCTHVWNYAFSMPSLFPSLERTLRETELLVSQNKAGHQFFRTNLPISPTIHTEEAAADGQLGVIMKTYRDYISCGDKAWLRGLFSGLRACMDFCIEQWDPEHKGALTEPHLNTYDISFWGPDSMCNSFYLGALSAMIKICRCLDTDCGLYTELLDKGKRFFEKELWNGEYFIQKIILEGLREPADKAFIGVSPEVADIIRREGPKYQYGSGCLSDGVIGFWMAKMCGLGDIINPDLIRAHLQAVYKYNFKADLSSHSNTQRPSFALGRESGLLICTWPNGVKPYLPFLYSDEVWTGIEYQVASHMASFEMFEECTAIIKGIQGRYDGIKRNPFDNYEAGHFYARSMSSYALIRGYTGVLYDASEKTMYLKGGQDYKTFFCVGGCYGTAGIKNGKPFFNAVSGDIEINNYRML